MSSIPEEDLLRMSLSGSPTTPSSTFTTHKTDGNNSFRAGDYLEAIRHYTLAEQADPLSPLPPANRAMALLKLNRWTEAKTDASVALELVANQPLAQRSLPLQVKILLRRATANENLMLYALAADDYAHVLAIDRANDVAKGKLEELALSFGVQPSQHQQQRGQSPSYENTPNKITLLSSTSSLPNGHPPKKYPPPQTKTSHIPENIQNEAPLFNLPESHRQRLVASWANKPPSSPSVFERVWKSLSNDSLARANYLLHQVTPHRIRNSLLGDTLTPQLIQEFIHVLSLAIQDDDTSISLVADFLHALTTVPRFGMLLMFFSDREKKPVQQLIDQLQAASIPPHLITELRDRYS